MRREPRKNKKGYKALRASCFEKAAPLSKWANLKTDFFVENDFFPSVFVPKFFLIVSDFSVFSRFLLIFLFIFVSY